MPRLVIIDSHALLHRAYHALPKDNLTQKGKPVNAVYGFFSMLISTVEQLNPDYLVTCFDAPGPTFRHKKFVAYQAHRPEVEEELKDQIKLTREVLKNADIPMSMIVGYEADDLAGTISLKAKSSNLKAECIIVTGDKDLMQLVDDQTSLFLLGRGISQSNLVGEKEVEEKLGVKPDQVVDYKGLAGDASDNYPGVYGIGPKTAQKLLDKYDSLENIYQNLDKISDSVRKKLEKGRESADLSYDLAKIVSNAPVDISWQQTKWDDEKLIKLKQSLKSLNFRSLVSRIESKFNAGRTNDQLELL